jgi:uncharacterized membrane protein YccC
MKQFLATHATGIGQIAAGVILYFIQTDHTLAFTLIGSGLFSFGIKIGTGTITTTKKP